MPDVDPFTLVPQELRLRKRAELAYEAQQLAAQVRNGYLREKSQRYKRQWLERACLALEGLAVQMGEYPWGITQTIDFHAALNLRSLALAAARGEAEEPLVKSGEGLKTMGMK